MKKCVSIPLFFAITLISYSEFCHAGLSREDILGEITQKGFKEMNWGDNIQQTSLREQKKELMPIGPVEYLLEDGVNFEFDSKTEDNTIVTETCDSRRLKVFFCENMFSAIKAEFDSTVYDYLKKKFTRELGFPRETSDLGDRHTEVWIVQPFRVEMVKESKYLSVMVEYLPINNRCIIKR